MAEASLVISSLYPELITAGRHVLDLLDSKRFKVIAAFWVRPEEDRDYMLKIVTPELKSRGVLEAYRRVGQLLKDADLPVALYNMSLVDKSDAQYKSLKKHHTVQNGNAHRVGRTYGDGVVIDEAVIYRLG